MTATRVGVTLFVVVGAGVAVNMGDDVGVRVAVRVGVADGGTGVEDGVNVCVAVGVGDFESAATTTG